MHDDQDQFLDDAMSTALEALDHEPDMMKIAEPFRTVALVMAAQGVIDNGGLCNFFGADFWHDQPYAVIIDAYHLCGAIGAAGVLEEALRFFPFEMPHRRVEQRRDILRVLEEDEESRFWKLDHMICGDERVYDALATYVRRHDACFPPQKPQPARPRNDANDEEYYKRGLEIQEEFLGPDHPNVAATLEDLAALYVRTNRADQAEALSKRALAIRAKHEGHGNRLDS